ARWRMDARMDGGFDAIVVGSGPGGGSVANELSKRGRKVLILEKGTGEAIAGTIAQTIRMALIPGRGLHFTPQLLGLIHAITLGGSSIIYYANAFEPPYEVFDRYGIDLRAEVAAVKAELPIAPLADGLLGPAAQSIMTSARELGYAWNPLPKLVYQDKCRTNCDKCVMGCPYGAKWTSRRSVEEACEDGAVLLTGAGVERVLQEDGRAVGVAFTQRGEQQRAYARTIILAAGGIGTPLILRQSGIHNAGSDFFFDPLIFAIGEGDEQHGGKEFPMATGCSFPEEGYLLTDLVLPQWLYWLFTAQVLRFDRLPAHSRALPIMIKARDELGGQLTKRGGVRKRLSETERKRLRHGYEHARRILTNAGARKIYKTWYLAVHPGGTAKINDVVDANLKTEVDNLYVCDCSVIPEAWGLPPSLTLLALGKRLGKHLAGESSRVGRAAVYA
ncbi:MAG: GMC family oxidoreductase N-terminal domain-containing protein, partial [Anaerolineae bacterium]|nr:GMC family oxidoreductase N-terminal domain-containing protein [Anaerolineae bacterium]